MQKDKEPSKMLSSLILHEKESSDFQSKKGFFSF